MTRQSKHIKRIAAPKTWPIAKKGYKYIMKPVAGKNLELCLPVCIIFRDILKLVETRHEIQTILNAKDILINNKVVTDSNYPVGFFDIISVPRIKKHYRLEISSNKKLSITEINEKDSLQKPYKVIGKTILKKGRVQLNLYEGANFIGNKDDIKKIKVNDAVLVDTKQNKIVKHIPFQQGSFAWVIRGKHIGNKGEITHIDKDLVTLKTGEKQIKTIIENIYITN